MDGIPNLYQWQQTRNRSCQVMTRYWGRCAGRELLHLSFGGASPTALYRHEDTYMAVLPNPIPPGERLDTFSVTRSTLERDRAQVLDGNLRCFNYTSTPNISWECALAVSIRLPYGARLERADPAPDAVSSDGVLTWHALLPPMPSVRELLTNRPFFQCTVEYAIPAVTPSPEPARPLEFTTPEDQALSKDVFALTGADDSTVLLALLHRAEAATWLFPFEWYMLGLALYERSCYTEADTAFARIGPEVAVEDTSLLFGARVWQGLLHDLQGDRERALVYYHEALAVDVGHNFMEHSRLGLLLDNAWVQARLISPYTRESSGTSL